MGPAASLAGRNLGQDFTIKDGWRMYHGTKVPGFPQHPHRGFETITVVPRGLVDHSDSLGAAGRFGDGDVQWMTAGKGVLHSEMFPLLSEEEENPLLLFQIWLNLPGKDKFVEPHFAMLWGETIPTYTHTDEQGLKTTAKVIAGNIDGVQAPPPAPNSWAADPAHEVGIWTIQMEPGATWTLPKASAAVNRKLYFYQGDPIEVAGQKISLQQGLHLQADAEVRLQSGSAAAHLLLLIDRFTLKQ